ncbi:XRE family transcriptional regulator [Burkholderia sp. Bp9017]|uniref:helix-turn-helix domain-containing protein n=1 Tax=unclassified Burkholderia TaxID=2613784 RepID=UPI000F5E8F2F|nr:XRE family transcriptional regulator [Burkholderia sp. Bp9017]RQZ37688.1 XRE family transcriptional regulator [Burkholderia sp. Bp9016]
MDLQFIALELKRLGMSQVEIARAVDCSQPTISEIQSGRIGKSRPSYHIASALIKLYEQKLAESAKEAK